MCSFIQKHNYFKLTGKKMHQNTLIMYQSVNPIWSENHADHLLSKKQMIYFDSAFMEDDGNRRIFIS